MNPGGGATWAGQPISCPPATGVSPTPPVRTKAEKAAHDFEAVLLTSLLEGLQKSFTGVADDDPGGGGHYGLLGTQALASAMAAGGGIGIARLILQQWQHTKVLDARQTKVPVGG